MVFSPAVAPADALPFPLTMQRRGLNCLVFPVLLPTTSRTGPIALRIRGCPAGAACFLARRAIPEESHDVLRGKLAQRQRDAPLAQVIDRVPMEPFPITSQFRMEALSTMVRDVVADPRVQLSRPVDGNREDR